MKLENRRRGTSPGGKATRPFLRLRIKPCNVEAALPAWIEIKIRSAAREIDPASNGVNDITSGCVIEQLYTSTVVYQPLAIPDEERMSDGDSKIVHRRRSEDNLNSLDDSQLAIGVPYPLAGQQVGGLDPAALEGVEGMLWRGRD